MGAEGFHGRVRDGIVCFTLAMTTRSSEPAAVPACFCNGCSRVFANEDVFKDVQAFERLGPVSCTRYRASTPGLSTWWSSTALIGSTRFEVGFPLRCLQRLSRPHIATLLCRWHDNRSTRGASIPVLSY